MTFPRHRVRIPHGPDQHTREQHDLSAEVILMAMAEAGYPMVKVWRGDRYEFLPREGGVTDDLAAMFVRATILGMDAAGIEYILEEREEDDRE